MVGFEALDLRAAVKSLLTMGASSKGADWKVGGCGAFRPLKLA